MRYYLLREITPTEDGDFTYEKFEQRYNSDLAGGIGNLVARTLAMATKLNPKSQIPNPKQALNSNLQKEIERIKKECGTHIEKFQFNEALKSIWELISFCDRYINEQKPWEGKENASEVISDILFALDNVADLLVPFLPETSERIKRAVESRQSENLFPRVAKPLT